MVEPEVRRTGLEPQPSRLKIDLPLTRASPALDSVTTVFLDTEGFEGTGKAAVYDDRIFAFSALIASVLVYNLVETIREADI